MAQQNLVKLASQGRAYSPGRGWTAEELDSLIALEKDCNLSRDIAADYIRNGIFTKEEYEASQEAGFTPKTLEVMQAESVVAHAESVRKALKLDAKKEAEAKAEAEKEAAEAEAKADAEAKAAKEAAKK